MQHQPRDLSAHARAKVSISGTYTAALTACVERREAAMCVCADARG